VLDFNAFHNLHYLVLVVSNQMKEIEVVIPGEPVAQGRPRFSSHGGFPRAYDPKKSKEGKQSVRFFVAKAMQDQDIEILSGPIMMRVQFGIKLPKSQERKRTPRPRVWRVKKPDLDNLIKLIKDGCSGIAFLDDNQIVKVSAEKIQCAQGEAPFTKIRFTELEELS
jgi:Holliday junction resolvase RusA-like endonuclease